MDAKNQFDAEAYFRELCETNRLAQANNFAFCTCTGIEGLEGALARYREANAIFCVDDTNAGSMVRTGGRGWVKNRTLTVFLMHRYKMGNMTDRAAKLTLCRQLMRQLVSRMIVDEHNLNNELIYLDTANILCREFGAMTLSGCTGLYFMIDVAEPVDVCYDSSEWTR